MKANNNYDNKKVKTNEKEKRSIMYSQIFNYNSLGRDQMMRSVEVTAAVEAGGKDITNKKVAVYTVLVIAAFFVFCYLRHPVAQAVNKFILENSEVEMQLIEPEFVTFKQELIPFQSVTNKSQKGDAYVLWTSWDNWEDIPFENVSKDIVKGNVRFKFSKFDIGTYTDGPLRRVGIVTTYVTDANTDKLYPLKGYFKVEDYSAINAEIVNVGEKATFAYQSKNDITAYFIRNWSYGDYTVYFMLDKILFEMEVSASKESVEEVKQIIDAMMG